MVDYDEIAELDDNGSVPAIAWMDCCTNAPDICLDPDRKVDLWGLCKMMTELECISGNVAAPIAAGAKWLYAYPNLPRDLLTQVGILCADS